jgi:RNA polymerase sigma factor (sigma-70 family)
VKTVASAPANHILQHLRDLIRRHSGGGVTDGQLLERFVRERDETAFEVLVWRHGPMVLALGQRMLHNGHDAEDVLQATFLTLVRKAGSIGKRDSLGSWLYKVAYRIALRVQSRAARTMTAGPPIEEVPAADRGDEADWRELRPLLDGAIERLPEKYRTALVLCELQGKSYREVAEQLGCPIGTVSTRVTRARQLLRKRLAHQGLALSLGVLTAALTRQTATAMPASLTASTVRAAVLLTHETGGAAGTLSPPVAELIEGANQAMMWTRFKFVSILALGIGVLAVCATVMARREPPAPPADTLPAKQATAKAEKPAAGPVQVRGRVLDPDDKPIPNARLYWPRVPKTTPQGEDDIEIPQRGKTDIEGRFQFELPRSDIKPDWNLALLAVADGYGVAWTFWSAIEKGDELTLRLVKDQPIEGRIVNTEGKPQAGVRVSIHTLAEPIEVKLDAFIALWQREWRTALHESTQRMFLPLGKVLAPVTTDKDGRFRIIGAGAERFVVLRVRGAEVTQESLHVVNRAGFDAAAVNKAVLDRIPAELRQPGQPPQLYGPQLTYVVPASRRIEGTVREAGSGKPVPGFRIHIGTGYGEGMIAISDKEGRYHFDRVTKVKQYLLNADPPANTTWLMSGARIDDTEGVQPLTVDFTVARGILLTGRVIDKTTGKGVRGGIRYVPLPGNKFAKQPGYDSYQYERLMRTVDNEGRFKFPVIPGPGVLMVQVHGGEKANGGQTLNPYKQAEFDAKDREHVKITESDGGYFTALDNSIEFLGIEHAVKYLDLAPDAGTAECNLFLDRGQTLTVKIEDAEGQPLKGTTVAGVTAGWPNTMPIRDASCTIFALDPKKPRRLLVYHAERKLAGSLMVRGDEKEPPVARLAPTGSVTGRVLDRDGQPIAGADVQLSSPEQIASELYRQLSQRQKAIHTDKDGRFRIDGIVPEVKFNLNIYQGRTFLVGEPRIGVRQVKSGATLDLGDVRTKPGP